MVANKLLMCKNCSGRH